MLIKYGHLKERGDNSYTFKLSDESLDRHGEKMSIAGIDITNFKSNPVAFFNHESQNLPIGKWVNIRKQNGELLADLVFSEKIPESAKIKDYVDEGLLNAVSVGFQPIEMKKEKLPSELSNDARFSYKNYIVNHIKTELLEASIVTIPANPNAVHVKAGAVLNNKNKSNLMQAMDLIQSVIDSASQEQGETQEKSINKLDLINILKGTE